MECKFCGHQNDENDKFCAFCGQPLNSNENNINETNEIILEKNNIEYENTSTLVSVIDGPTKALSIISICVYFFIFYFLVSILSTISISIVLAINEITIPSDVDLSDYLVEYYPDIYYNFLATMNLAIYLLSMAIVVPLLIKFLITDFKNAIRMAGNFWKNFGLGIAILFVANTVANYFIIFATTALKVFPDFKDISTTSGNQSAINDLLESGIYPMLVVIIMTTILAPILEELIFRKCFFNLSKNKGIAIIFISGAIFGSIHTVESVISIVQDIVSNVEGVSYANIVMELLNFTSYFVSGIALGFIYKRSNYNIWVNIMVHSLYNFIGVIAYILTAL